MKKLTAFSTWAIACILLFVSCMHRYHEGDVSLTVTDHDHYYLMDAQFSKSKTRAVNRYIESRIGDGSGLSFASSQMDGAVSLDDQTIVYIKRAPGRLRIRFDKDENSDEAYKRVRELCEGLRPVLIK